MDLSGVLERFQRVRKNGRGFSACCPSHEDKKNSLSITEADGKILIKCFAGCDAQSVTAAVGLKLSDLFADRKDRPRDPVTNQYVYSDEKGCALFRVCRTESKGFFQQRFEAGKFVSGMNGVRRVIFNLREVLKAKNVIVVEGEKDCETLRAVGLAATTNVGGAGKWDDSYNEFFKGKRVTVIGDNDEPGQSHASRVARSLLAFAEEVKLVQLPDVPPKGDVTDYLRGHSQQALLDLIKATKPQTKKQDDEGLGVGVNQEEEEPQTEPTTALPECAWWGPFAAWDEIVTPCTEAPREYLWASCLVTIGLVLGRNIRLENPRPLYPNFYTLLMGPTGDDRKSTALYFAGEALFQLGMGSQVDILRGIQSSEAIYESLARMDGAKSLAYSDEFRSLLTVAKRKGSQDIIPRLSSLYYCPAEDNLNRRDDSTVVVNPFFSLIAATPAEYVQDLLSNLEIEGGFINRFLTITGDVKGWKAIAPKPSAWGRFTVPVRDIGSHYDASLRMCSFMRAVSFRSLSFHPPAGFLPRGVELGPDIP